MSDQLQDSYIIESSTVNLVSLSTCSYGRTIAIMIRTGSPDKIDDGIGR